MIDYYIKEFLAICDFIKKSGNGKITLDYIIVRKSIVLELLERNKYETASNKLKLWKQLNWIDSDKDRLTKRIYDPESKKYVAYVKIYKKVYAAFKEVGCE